MNKRLSTPLQFILGGYLTFTGVKLLIDMIRERPTDMALKVGFAVLFIAFGVWYLIRCGKEAYQKHKEKQEEKREEQLKIEEEEKAKEHRKLHSNTKFRTAPMNVEEINQKAESKESDKIEPENKSNVVSLNLSDNESDDDDDFEEI